MFQQAMTNILETNEKTENLSKEIKKNQMENLDLKDIITKILKLS